VRNGDVEGGVEVIVSTDAVLGFMAAGDEVFLFFMSLELSRSRQVNYLGF
jgi:hypothetical protein